MDRILKRMAVIFMMLTMILSTISVLGAMTGGTIGGLTAYAESEGDVETDGFAFHIWYSEAGASVALRNYTGTDGEIILPDAVTFGGQTYAVGSDTQSNWFFVESTAFAGNTAITKAAIPSGYGSVSAEAFAGCTGLTEVSVGSFAEPEYGGLGSDAFKGCTNLITYNIDSTGLDAAYAADNSRLEQLKNQIKNAGIGIDESGSPIGGIEVNTQENSVVWAAITELNESRDESMQIRLTASDDPYSKSTISRSEEGEGGESGGSDVTPGDGDSTPGGGSDAESNSEIAAAKEILNNAIAEAKKIVQGNFTDESFKALQDAIKDAEALVAGSSATKAQLEAAAGMIAAAKNALKAKEETKPADPTPSTDPAPTELTEEEKAIAAAKEVLNNAIAEAKKIAQGNFTDESFKVLQDAIKGAEALVAGSSATKAQLEAAVGMIAAAKNALKAKEDAKPADPTPSTDPAPSADPAPADPSPTTDPAKQYGEGNSPVGKGASVEAAEAAIAGMTSDNDLPGALFSKLQLKSSKQTNTSITISWKKVSGVKYYVIYGNKCGKANKMKRLARSTGKSKTFTKVLGKKVKKGTYYKFMVIAYDKNDKVVSASKIVHVATKGGKVGNVGKITTKAKKNKVSIKKGKTFKLKGKQAAASKKLKVRTHRKLSYESSNTKVATVSKSGVIKGKKKGSCYVYVYAQNGVFSKIKVTIK